MYIKLRVTPDAKEESFIKTDDTHFEVRVKQSAERNLANTRVLELVRAHFKTNNVRLVSGHHSPSKIVAVEM